MPPIESKAILNPIGGTMQNSGGLLYTYTQMFFVFLQMVNASAKLLSRSVSQKVQTGMDVTVGNVTLPNMRNPSKIHNLININYC